MAGDFLDALNRLDETDRRTSAPPDQEGPRSQVVPGYAPNTGMGAALNRLDAIDGEPTAILAESTRLRVPWADVEKKLGDVGVNPEAVKQEYLLNEQRWKQEDQGIGVGEAFIRNSLPFGSFFDVKGQQAYGEALARHKEGKATGEDLERIARYERLSQIEQDQGQTFAGKLVQGLAGVPKVVGEFGAAGKAVGAAGRAVGLGRAGTAAGALAVPGQNVMIQAPRTILGSRAAGAVGGHAARMAATLPAVPSMYLEQARTRNLEEGRDANDWRGFPTAVGMGYANALILGSIQKFAQGIPGGMAARAGGAGVIGAGEQQIADIAGGVADEFLSNAYRTDTKYGAIGEILRGHSGEALQNLTVEALTFGLFGAMHDRGPKPKRGTERITTYNPLEDVDFLDQRIGLARGRGEGVDTITSMVDALSDLTGRGHSKESAARQLDFVHGQFLNLMRDNPNANRIHGRQAAEKFRDPALRSYAESLAETLPPAQLAGREPAAAPEMVRLYHGGQEGTQGELWFTPDLADAQGWAGRQEGMKVQYVDVPANHPALEKLKVDVSGTGMRQPYQRGVLPAELAANRKPLPEPVATGAMSREDLKAQGFRLVAKSSDLFEQGYSVSEWLNPTTKEHVVEFNPRVLPGEEIGDRRRYTARNYDEQKAVHEAIGAPVVGQGEAVRPKPQRAKPAEVKPPEPVYQSPREEVDALTVQANGAYNRRVEADRALKAFEGRNLGRDTPEVQAERRELQAAQKRASKDHNAVNKQLQAARDRLMLSSATPGKAPGGPPEAESTPAGTKPTPGAETRQEVAKSGVPARPETAPTPPPAEKPAKSPSKGLRTDLKQPGKVATEGVRPGVTEKPAGEFSADVKAAARTLKDFFGKKFDPSSSSHKVLIADLYDALGRTEGLPAFKQALLGEAMKGRLTLSRVDMVMEAYDFARLQASETEYMNAHFHTVMIEPGEAPASPPPPPPPSGSGEYQVKKRGLRDAVADAKAKRVAPPKKTLESLRDKFAAGGEVTLSDVFDVQGLGSRERHVIEQRLMGRTHAEIAKDPEVLGDGTKISRQRIERIEASARKKLGAAESIAKAVHESQQAEGMAERQEAAGRVRAEELGEGKKRGPTVEDLEDAAQNRALAELMKLKAREPQVAKEVDDVAAAASRERIPGPVVQRDVAQTAAEAAADIRGEAEAQAEVEREPGKRGLVGNGVAILVAGGEPVASRYEVREASEVRASQQALANGGIRDRVKAGEYPPQLQPRDYMGDPNQRLKVDEFSRVMEPSYFISEHADATNGPPTITDQGIVINGNGRQMMIESSIHSGTYAKYRDYLVKNAARYGLDPAAVAKLREPALYRVVEIDPESPEAREFARRGNTKNTAADSMERTAASLSSLVSDDVLRYLRLDADTTFSKAVNDKVAGRQFRQAVYEAIPVTERSTYFQPGTTDLNAAGKDLVSKMLLSKILPIETIERVSAERREVLNTVEAAVPLMLKLRRDAAGMNPSVPLTEALDVLARHPDVKTMAEADALFTQRDMFSGGDVAERITPSGRMMLDFILAKGGSPRQFREGIRALIQDQNPRQSLLGDVISTDPIDMAADALGVRKRQGAAFGRGVEEPMAPDAHLARANEALFAGFPIPAKLMDAMTKFVLGNRPAGDPGNFAIDRDTNPDNHRRLPDWDVAKKAAANQLGARNGTPMDVATTGYAWMKHVNDQIANQWLIDAGGRYGDPFKVAQDGTFVLANGQRGYLEDVMKAEMQRPGSQPLTSEQRAVARVWRSVWEKRLREMEAAGVKQFRDESGDLYEVEDLLQKGYFPRPAVEKTAIGEAWEAFMRGAGNVATGGGKLGTNPFYRKGRRHATEAEGVAAGVKYKSDWRERVSDFLKASGKEIAGTHLIKDVGTGAPEAIRNKFRRLIVQNKDVLKSMKINPKERGAFIGRLKAQATEDVSRLLFQEQEAGRYLKLGQAAFQELRNIVLGPDVSYATLQLQSMMFTNPGAWARTVAKIPDAFFRGDTLQKLSNSDPTFRQAMQEIVQAGGSIGTLPEQIATLGGKKSLVSRVPVVGAIYERFGRAFSTAMDLAKIELWKANRPTNQAEWARTVEAIENSLGQGRMEQLGMSPERALLERITLLAPSYYRGFTKLVQQATQRGVPGYVARKQLASLASGVLLTGVAALYALKQTGAISDEEMEERLDITRGKFLTIPVPAGEGKHVDMGLGGFYLGIARTLGNAAAWQQGEKSDNPFLRWYRGHAGVMPRMFLDLTTERDFAGKKVGPGQVLARNLTPIAAQNLLFDDGTGQQRGEVAGAGMLGLRAFPGTDNSDFMERLRKLAVKEKGKKYSALTFGEQAALVAKLEREGGGKTKNPSSREAVAGAAEAAELRRNRIHELVGDETRATLKELGHTLPSYENSITVRGVEVPLDGAKQRQYQELLAEEYRNIVSKLDVKRLKDARPDVKDDYLVKKLKAAKNRAQQRLMSGKVATEPEKNKGFIGFR